MRYRERLAAVTSTQIHAAAQRFLATDHMVIVVVGDGQRILPGLKALGPVRIVTTDGQPMTEADLAPRASAVAWHAASITAGVTRARVLVQGNPFGDETRTVTRVQEGGRDAWQVITVTNIGPVLQQTDTTTFDAATFTPIRVRQGGRQQGQETFVRLDYAGGRVRGQARAVQQSGPHDVTIDTALAAGVVDDNMLSSVILALPYAADARWTIPVFSGGKGTVDNMTFHVVGEESVTTPAGTFACWKVDVTGGPVPVTFYVSKDNPAAVKLELQGVPLVFELTARN
jgi:hypothetical protein